MYQIVLCPKFRGKQTKFGPLYSRKCKKRFENLNKHNLARNFKHLTIFSILTISTQKYIPNSVMCQVSWQTNKV